MVCFKQKIWGAWQSLEIKKIYLLRLPLASLNWQKPLQAWQNRVFCFVFFFFWYDKKSEPHNQDWSAAQENCQDLSFLLASWSAILRVWFSSSGMKEKSPTSNHARQGGTRQNCTLADFVFCYQKSKCFPGTSTECIHTYIWLTKT